MKEYNDLVLHINPNDCGTTVEFSEKIREELTEIIEQNERDAGYEEKYHDDDYLFVAHLIMKAQNCYMKMNVDPFKRQYRVGYKKMPYIHLILNEDDPREYDVHRNVIINDKKLSVRVCKNSDNDKYELEFNRYILVQLLKFIQNMFDKNEEIIVDLSNVKATSTIDGSEVNPLLSMKEEKLVDRNAILEQAVLLKQIHGLENVGEEVIRYAHSLGADERVYMPAVCFYQDSVTSETISINVSYFDSQRECETIQLRKPIFNTKAFEKWFEKRNELVERVFESALEMIISHEFAHIANGHIDLKNHKKSYCSEREIAMCLEENADDTAIRWRMYELLFDGIDGNAQNPQLAWTKEGLKEEWVIRSFSAYIAMSWIYRGKERIWDENTISNFQAKESEQGKPSLHPIYNYRVFNIVNRALNCLQNIILEKDSEKLITSDGQSIDKTLIDETSKEMVELIESFEKYFNETYDDKRSWSEKMQQTTVIDKDSKIEKCETLPYLLPILLEDANREFIDITKKWPELMGELNKIGTYCKLYKNMAIELEPCL